MVPIKIGFVTDVQYADIENVELCHYRSSLYKLSEAIDYFNLIDLDFVIQLGDFIEKDWESFDSVFEIWNKLKHKFYHVLGNHDFEVENFLKAKVPEQFGLEKTYYSFTLNDWNFIFLNGNDLSLTAFPKNSKEYQISEAYLNSFSPKPEWWNGAIGKDQMEWLNNKLSEYQNKGGKTIIFCHFPIYPNTEFCLWNNKELIDLISKHSCVKAWINGHHHAGSYSYYKNIHYVTFRGMVTSNENSFGIMNIFNDKINIAGFGREISRTLNFSEKN